jgi:hypothetical protein
MLLLPSAFGAFVTIPIENIIAYWLGQLKLLAPYAVKLASLPRLYRLFVLPIILALCRAVNEWAGRVTLPWSNQLPTTLARLHPLQGG